MFWFSLRACNPPGSLEIGACPMAGFGPLPTLDRAAEKVRFEPEVDIEHTIEKPKSAT